MSEDKDKKAEVKMIQNDQIVFKKILDAVTGDEIK